MLTKEKGSGMPLRTTRRLGMVPGHGSGPWLGQSSLSTAPGAECPPGSCNPKQFVLLACFKLPKNVQRSTLSYTRQHFRGNSHSLHFLGGFSLSTAKPHPEQNLDTSKPKTQNPNLPPELFSHPLSLHSSLLRASFLLQTFPWPGGSLLLGGLPPSWGSPS